MSDRDRLSRTPLDRRTVLDAALALVDTEGLARLTMRRLAGELGVEAMSLYHHVRNKGDLIDGLVDRVYAEVSLEDLPSDWPGQILAGSRSLRRALLAHPNMLPEVAIRPVLGDPTFGLIEVALALLGELGLDAETAREVLNVLVCFIIGHALTEAGTAAGLGGHSLDEVMDRRAGLPSDRFPLAREALGSRPEVREVEFELGIRLLVTGIRDLVEGAADPPVVGDQPPSGGIRG